MLQVGELVGAGAAGLAIGWLAVHCARSSRPGIVIRWALGLALPYISLATLMAGAPAGAAAAAGMAVGMLGHHAFTATIRANRGGRYVR